MAIRKIRTEGDSILTKECRKVEKMTPKIQELIEDMFDTCDEVYGADWQPGGVGVLKEIVVIDTTGEDPLVLINPEIIETSGSQTGDEGLLCVPGMSEWSRPNHVKVRAFDENMEEYILEGEELLARAICHETDHLHGRLYTELVEGELHRTSYEEDDE